MRTIIPGKCSPAYLKRLYEHQKEFYKSIMADEETVKKAEKAWPPDGSKWRNPAVVRG